MTDQPDSTKTAEDWERLGRDYVEQAHALSTAAREVPCESGCCGLPPSKEQMGLHEKAIEALEEAIRLGRNTALNHYQIYWNHHFLGHTDECEDACQNALAVDPEYEPASFALGGCLSLMGDNKQAAAAYKRCLTINPEKADTYVQLANCHLLLKEPEKMVEIAATGREHFPDDNDLMRLHFNGLVKCERYEEALPLAESAIELDPDDYGPHVGIGHLYRSLEREEDALVAFRTAHRLNPDASAAFNPLIDMLEQSDQREEALEILDGLAKRPVEDTVTGFGLGERLYRRKRYAHAIQVLTQVTEQTKIHAGAFLTLSKSHRKLGHMEEAKHSLDAAIDASTSALARLEESLPAMRAYDKKAGSDCADAISIYTYRNAIEIYLEAGDLEEARIYLKALRPLDAERAQKYDVMLQELEGAEQ